MQLKDALESGFRVTDIFVADVLVHEGGWTDAEVPPETSVWRVTPPILKALADTTTPQGIVAVVGVPDRSIAGLEDPSLVVVLADVRDPGNAGTLIRSAAAAGADAIVFPRGSVDPFAPKTVRAAAGALFKIPVIRGVQALEAVQLLKQRGLVAVAAVARGGASPYEIDLARPLALVLGNEAWGLPVELRSQIDETATIPMPGATESLNVGIAGSIILFEAVRQRAPRTSRGRALSSPNNG
ncbi:MAG TPA: RNA methyltransferase [Actinomycetota bacterium]|nr:RNA methyltransferase [Actinomycetota bacterium]